MPPFFLDVWMEIAENQHGAPKMVDKKTLFFFPVNDDVAAPAATKDQKRKTKE